jgi:hypothetical protein
MTNKETVDNIRAIANDERGDPATRAVAQRKLEELRRLLPALFEPTPSQKDSLEGLFDNPTPRPKGLDHRWVSRDITVEIWQDSIDRYIYTVKRKDVLVHRSEVFSTGNSANRHAIEYVALQFDTRKKPINLSEIKRRFGPLIQDLVGIGKSNMGVAKIAFDLQDILDDWDRR